MKKFFKIAWRTMLLLILSINFAKAAVIGFTANAIAGNNWRYEYTVTNNSPSLPLEEFTIFFDEDKVGSIFNAAGPAGWDLLLIQPDTGIPAAGFLDALSLEGGLAFGDTAIFTVEFAYLGSGIPGAQLFSVIDPITFQTLENGFTQGPAAVPAPATGWLLLAAAAAMIFALRSRPASHAKSATVLEVCHG